LNPKSSGKPCVRRRLRLVLGKGKKGMVLNVVLNYRGARKGQNTEKGKGD